MNKHIIPRASDQSLAGLPLFFRLICEVSSKIKIGRLTFVLPDGERIDFAGEDGLEHHGEIHVKDFAFARRAFFGGDIGFFESFADDQWSTPDLASLLYIFARNAEYMQEVFHAVPFFSALNRLRHRFNRNTKSGSRKNIIAHYDLGNEFYQTWLDSTMTYSSARFDNAAALSDAQLNKYRAMAERIELREGERVLEIGSGWGGFAEFAAKNTGANIVGITLSPSQLEFARERIYREGLAEKVQFRLQDYRDVADKFDKVASIEMFEAVGMQYWQTYFDKIRDVLNPGGMAGLQIITIDDKFFDNYVREPDFIQRYVFPGGMLPSPEKLRTHIDKAGLAVRSLSEFGLDYARTLNEWRERFLGAWDAIQPLGFDERFKKMWQFYLAYCEAGFRAGTTNVRQITLAKP